MHDREILPSRSFQKLAQDRPNVQVGQKLSTAHVEPQPCEAHLAAKERELNAFRARTISSGLEERCKAKNSNTTPTDPYSTRNLARLKKRTKRESVQAPQPSRMAPESDKGHASDTLSESVSKATRARKRTVLKPRAIDGIRGSMRIPGKVVPLSARLLKKAGPPAAVSPSSTQSVISAVPPPPGITPTTGTRSVGLGSQTDCVTGRATIQGGPQAQRNGVGVDPNGAALPTVRSLLTIANGEPSLMSIVESISHMNREAVFGATLKPPLILRKDEE
ncbi:hypothetical protein LXA43DRAFT_1067116 [Ganoderma leucocontextum]|nr:hypothetical protein LXA43DRAFT_1067116 [Ganoderma leucocontextum]